MEPYRKLPAQSSLSGNSMTRRIAFKFRVDDLRTWGKTIRMLKGKPTPNSMSLRQVPVHHTKSSTVHSRINQF